MCLITVGPISVPGTVQHIRQSSSLKEFVIITIIIVVIKKKEEKKKNREEDVNQVHLLARARLFPRVNFQLDPELQHSRDMNSSFDFE